MRPRLTLLTAILAIVALIATSSAGALALAQGQGQGQGLDQAPGQQEEPPGQQEEPPGQQEQPVEPALQDGQPGAAPDELVLEDQRYQFDRTVPIDLGTLEQVAEFEGLPVYAKPDDPLGARYTSGDPEPRRYLPEFIGVADAACPSATTQAFGGIQADALYVPAGIEPDIPAEQLTEVGTTDDGRTLYAPSAEQPFAVLYATGGEGGLVRYLRIEPNGVPTAFPDRMVFGGQEFQLTAGETPSAEGLQPVGCALAFPALASGGEQPGALSAVYVQVNDQLVVYRSIGPVETPIAPVETVAPTEAPTTVPTAVPTEIPTEVPTAIPTAVPTEVPTAVPTEVPTQVPTAVPTEAPTAVPTQVPTEVPTAAPTAVPTEVPTQVPTAVPTEAPTAVPTQAPTAAPTEAAATTAPTQPAATTAPTPTVTVSRPTPTPQVLQPRAVVPTVPPDAPPPAASTADPVGCSGNAGPIGDDGLPERLPPAIQYGGTGYRYTETVPVGDIGDLSRVGCVGPFEVYLDEADGVLYLTLASVADTAYRYEVTSSFSVEVEVTADPRVLVLQGQGDQPDVRYRASDPLVRSVYSSVTLILYVTDAEETQPTRILGHAVDHDVFGLYLPEGEAEPAGEDVRQRAEDMGILPTLRLGTEPQVYVLVELWQPFGTTTNGWITLYGPEGEAAPDQLVGIDPRRLDLLVFNRVE